MRPEVIRPVLVATCLAVVGGVTLGLPGAPVLGAATALAGLVSPCRFGGDQAWPAALAISILGPFALVPTHLAVGRLHLTRGWHVLLTAGAALAAVAAVSAVGVASACG